MTTPVTHDHPDWQRTVSAADIRVIDFNDTQTVGTLSYGRVFVGNLPFLFITLAVSAGGARLALTFYPSESAVNAIGANIVDTRAGLVASGPIAVLGPWVDMTVTIDATPRTVILEVWQTLVAGQETNPPTLPRLITQDTVSVANNTATFYEATAVKWGWGFWHAGFENTTTHRIKLHQMDYLGVRTMWDFILNGAPDQGKLIPIPAKPLSVEAFHQEGAARFFWTTVLMHPGPL